MEEGLNIDKDDLFNLVADNPNILQALKEAIAGKVKIIQRNSQILIGATEAKKNHLSGKIPQHNQKPVTPKISSNFDPPPKTQNLLNPPMSKNQNTNTTSITNNSDDSNINTDDANANNSTEKQNPNNQAQTNSTINKHKPSVPSKPTFAAAVQEAIAAKKTHATAINIEHGTHLGKPAVFFFSDDYFYFSWYNIFIILTMVGGLN